MKRVVLQLILGLIVLSGCQDKKKQNESGKYDSYRGLVMAGYQGWFGCPDDGSGLGWYHYSWRNGLFQPGNTKVDMWPDVSEYPVTYKTEFSFADGSPAYVMSSYDETTVDTHFRWMQEYGIDGVFVQRFVVGIKPSRYNNHVNKVWESAIKAANKYERAVCIMYDPAQMKPGDEKYVLSDIDAIIAQYDIFERKNNPSYLHHNGKPLVSVVAVGAIDRPEFSLQVAEIMIDGLKERGFSIMIGVSTFWRELKNDVVNDSELHRIIKKCDILMPWFVGRYNEITFAPEFQRLVKDDIAWCKANNVDYAPLAFPGFSWRNMIPGSDQIPRNRGSFFKKQLSSHIASGAEMLYIAMFDEIDEATAIFKCATEVPVGESYFLALDKDLGSDYYLKLTGEAAEELKKKLKQTK